MCVNSSLLTKAEQPVIYKENINSADPSGRAV